MAREPLRVNRVPDIHDIGGIPAEHEQPQRGVDDMCDRAGRAPVMRFPVSREAAGSSNLHDHAVALDYAPDAETDTVLGPDPERCRISAHFDDVQVVILLAHLLSRRRFARELIVYSMGHSDARRLCASTRCVPALMMSVAGHVLPSRYRS